MIGWIFKLAMVALAAGFLWVYYTNTQNGRYQAAPTNSIAPLVLDTREGILYRPIIEDMSSNRN